MWEYCDSVAESSTWVRQTLERRRSSHSFTAGVSELRAGIVGARAGDGKLVVVRLSEEDFLNCDVTTDSSLSCGAST